VVPARVLPVPTTVSPELQKVIAAPPRRMPAVHGADEWRALQRERDATAAMYARALSGRLGVTVTPATIGGVKAFAVSPPEVAPEQRNRLLVHLHGGAYVLGAGEAGTLEAILAACFARVPVLSVDYRMPPEHPFPAALDDAVAAWKGVIEKHDPAKVALFGSSAGGGLTMATVIRLRDLGLPLPGALFLGTPWADLSKTGDTYFTLAGVDNVLDSYEGRLESAARLYAGTRPLTDPMISPVYGDVNGFPPTILLSGTRDLLLSCTVRAHRQLRQARVAAELHVFEGQSHAQYGTSFPSPESLEAIGEVARFFDRHLER
jgi:monoterpene epsilon-lactone hydrolase